MFKEPDQIGQFNQKISKLARSLVQFGPKNREKKTSYTSLKMIKPIDRFWTWKKMQVSPPNPYYQYLSLNLHFAQTLPPTISIHNFA